MTSSNLYDNITLSGGAGCGKSVLFSNLRSSEELQGWQFFQAGKTEREQTGENLNPTADKLSAEHHQSVEDHVRLLLTTKTHYLIDAWLGGFVARDLPRTLRVLIYMSDNEERARRVAERDGVTPEEAMSLIQDREERNMKFWRTLYGDYDFWDKKYYQLHIDSTHLSPEECMQSVLSNLRGSEER